MVSVLDGRITRLILLLLCDLTLLLGNLLSKSTLADLLGPEPRLLQVALREWESEFAAIHDGSYFSCLESFDVDFGEVRRCGHFFPVDDFEITLPSSPRVLYIANEDPWKGFISKGRQPCDIIVGAGFVEYFGAKRDNRSFEIDFEPFFVRRFIPN